MAMASKWQAECSSLFSGQATLADLAGSGLKQRTRRGLQSYRSLVRPCWEYVMICMACKLQLCQVFSHLQECGKSRIVRMLMHLLSIVYPKTQLSSSAVWQCNGTACTDSYEPLCAEGQCEGGQHHGILTPVTKMLRAFSEPFLPELGQTMAQFRKRCP